MSVDERLAIWRYATPEERQRVIDGQWDVEPLRGVQAAYIRQGDLACCPLGAAFPNESFGQRIENPLSCSVGDYLAQRADYDDVRCAASEFVEAWCRGRISRDDLIAYLRQLNAQESAQPGQATVGLAIGNWLAFVVACAVVAGCVYGAHWITMLWLAPWGGW